MGRGVSSGGGQSSLGYLFGSGEAPKPAATTNGTSSSTSSESTTASPSPPPGVAKEIPAGIPGNTTITNNYFRADGQNCGNFLTDRPTTKVHAAPGGGSSLDYLFGGNGK
ncbi:Protein SPIRAL1 [Hibiscus syriacus]|uniref:Protein SPIRAL1 n=1 Tax=Hibiscus syriacus TaxID=106335 RepID=A0A6A2WVY1_HIBSY|nr:Protein SPIRAL1 [Hibiscus syriacus]